MTLENPIGLIMEIFKCEPAGARWRGQVGTSNHQPSSS